MCVKMQLIQFNAHLLGEKDGSEFEEATSETDEQTEIKSEDQANKADGKIESEELLTDCSIVLTPGQYYSLSLYADHYCKSAVIIHILTYSRHLPPSPSQNICLP